MKYTKESLNATLDDKCSGFVNIEPLQFSLSLQQNGYGHTQLQLNQMVDKINELIDAVNENYKELEAELEDTHRKHKAFTKALAEKSQAKIAEIEAERDELKQKILDYINWLGGRDRELAEAMEIVNAVAHIGIDWGYGKFELTEGHIKKAREIYEAKKQLMQKKHRADVAEILLQEAKEQA